MGFCPRPEDKGEPIFSCQKPGLKEQRLCNRSDHHWPVIANSMPQFSQTAKTYKYSKREFQPTVYSSRKRGIVDYSASDRYSSPKEGCRYRGPHSLIPYEEPASKSLRKQSGVEGLGSLGFRGLRSISKPASFLVCGQRHGAGITLRPTLSLSSQTAGNRKWTLLKPNFFNHTHPVSSKEPDNKPYPLGPIDPKTANPTKALKRCPFSPFKLFKPFEPFKPFKPFKPF